MESTAASAKSVETTPIAKVESVSESGVAVGLREHQRDADEVRDHDGARRDDRVVGDLPADDAERGDPEQRELDRGSHRRRRARIASTKIAPHENTCPIVSARLQVAPLAHCEASTTNESVVQIVQVRRCGVVEPRRMSRM